MISREVLQFVVRGGWWLVVLAVGGGRGGQD